MVANIEMDSMNDMGMGSVELWSQNYQNQFKIMHLKIMNGGVVSYADIDGMVPTPTQHSRRETVRRLRKGWLGNSPIEVFEFNPTRGTYRMYTWDNLGTEAVASGEIAEVFISKAKAMKSRSDTYLMSMSALGDIFTDSPAELRPDLLDQLEEMVEHHVEMGTTITQVAGKVLLDIIKLGRDSLPPAPAPVAMSPDDDSAGAAQLPPQSTTTVDQPQGADDAN